MYLNLHPRTKRGFGLIEVLVSVAILGLLIGLAVPSYRTLIAQKRLTTASEDLYNHIRMSFSESLKRSGTFYLSFKPGATWCYGLSNTAVCDCTVANSCLVDSTETVVRQSDYSGQAISIAVSGFSGGSGNPSITFLGNLGAISAAGDVGFNINELATTVSANTRGLVTICSNSVPGYNPCVSP